MRNVPARRGLKRMVNSRTLRKVGGPEPDMENSVRELCVRLSTSKSGASGSFTSSWPGLWASSESVTVSVRVSSAESWSLSTVA